MQEIIQAFDFTKLYDILERVLPALFCIVVHEMCHGLAALQLGDQTAKQYGRLTLNPLKHLDVAGLIMLLIFRFGWAKPVPVDMRNFRHQKSGMALTAFAGPLGNFILAILIMFLLGILHPLLNHSEFGAFMIRLLSLTTYMSLGLGVFNLIPIPPLDGSKILFSFLSNKAYLFLMKYEKYGAFLLLLLAFTGVISPFLGRITLFLYSSVIQVAEFGLSLLG